MVWFWVELELELTREFGPVGNTTLASGNVFH